MGKKFIFISIFSIFLISCFSINDKKLQDNTNETSLIIVGTVIKIKEAVRTLSEFSYYVIKTSDREKTILFNKETKNSRGFDEYVGKKVKITGREIIGHIGWRKEAKPGILVKEIIILK